MWKCARFGVLAFAVGLAVVPPCARLGGQEPPASQTPTPPPQPPPAQKPLPPGGGRVSRPPIRFALPRRMYLCEGGVQVVTLLEANAVRLTLQGQVYDLARVESANGTRFAAGTLVWSIQSEGIFEDDADAANPKILAKGCRLQSTFPASATTVSVITGTVSFGPHPALPENAVLLVELRDQNLAMGDPAAELAQVRIPMKGRASPVTFELPLDRSKLSAKVRPALSASITSGANRLFRLNNPVVIPELTNPAPVALALSPASRGKSATPPPAKPQNPPQNQARSAH